jgi:hypothetical protein
MSTVGRTLLASLLVLQAPAAGAQTPADPSGHWEGAVQGPNVEMPIEVDLVKNGNGQFAGTFGQPKQGVKGLPLASVSVNARSVRFLVKGGEAPSMFDGVLSADGASIAGDVTIADYTLTFTVKRTGEARLTPAPRNARISKELEGTWNGALELGDRRMRLTVKMANQADGTATGTIVSADGSGVEIPIGIVENAANVTIDVVSVGASFAGVRNAESTELVGTWTQGSSTLPLTLHRSK